MINLNQSKIKKYILNLREREESADLIFRKLSSVDKFIAWAYERGYIKNNVFKQLKDEIANQLILNQSNLKP